jgi:ribosomal protein S18 acetylase RimI-like enzyme
MVVDSQQRKSKYDLVSDRLERRALGLQGAKNAWYLHFLAVRPEYQGMGIGKALVEYVTNIVLNILNCH